MNLRGDDHDAARRWMEAAEKGLISGSDGSIQPGYWRGTTTTAGPYYTDRDRSRRTPSPPELVDLYKSIVFTCTRINFNAISRVPLRLYATTAGGQHRVRLLDHQKAGVGRRQKARIKSIAGLAEFTKGIQEIEEITEHPLLTAITNVNPQWNHTSLVRYTSACLDLLGRSYWWMESERAMLPDFVWPLLPQYMIPMRDGPSSLIDHFNYGQMTIPYGEVVEIRDVAMRDPYALGVSPNEASFAHSDLFDSYTSYQRNVFEQGGRPSLVVSNKEAAEPLGKAERDRFQRDLNASLVRAGQGMIWFVDGALSVDSLSFPPSDLASLEISDTALQRVANAFGVPLSLLKTEDVNLANAEAGHRQHTELAIDPRCALIAAALTKWTRSLGGKIDRAMKAAGSKVRSGYDRLLWAFDNPTPEDEERQAKVFDIYLKNGTHTINDVRLELGYEAVEYGDEPWLSNTLVQPSTAEEQRQITNQRADQAEASKREALARGEKPGEDGGNSKPGSSPPKKPKGDGAGKAKAFKGDGGGGASAKGVPSTRAILDKALRNIGLSDTFGDGSISPADRLRVLHELRMIARAWLRREAERALAETGGEDEPTSKGLAGKAKEVAGRFFKRAGKFLRNALVAAALAVMGPGELTEAETRSIDRAHVVQVEYLDKWKKDVLAENAQLEPARAEQYGASVWGAGNGVLREAAIQSRAIEEGLRQHNGDDAPCPGCAEQIAKGWVPAAEVEPIGSQECRENCHCILIWRTTTGAEWIAGRAELEALMESIDAGA